MATTIIYPSPAPKPKRDWVDYLSLLIAIIGVVVSSGFAYLAWSNRDQITALDSIVSKQNTLLLKQDTFNTHFVSMIDGINNENRTLSLQLKNDNVRIQEDETIQADKFFMATYKIFDFFSKWDKNFREWSIDARMQNLDDIKAILYAEKENTFLHKNDTLYNSWMNAYRKAIMLQSQVRHYETIDVGLITANKDKTISQRPLIGKERQEMFDQDFDMYLQFIHWLSFECLIYIKKDKTIDKRILDVYDAPFMRNYILYRHQQDSLSKRK